MRLEVKADKDFTDVCDAGCMLLALLEQAQGASRPSVIGRLVHIHCETTFKNQEAEND